MDTEMSADAELSVEEAEARAEALIQAIRHARPLPDPAARLTEPQKAAVARFLRSNDAAKNTYHRTSLEAAHKFLKLAPFNLRMSRETFVAAVCGEFERSSWAKK